MLQTGHTPHLTIALAEWDAPFFETTFFVRRSVRRLPPLKSIRIFEAAARRSSFSDAAKDLCITQSAISHQIKLLEDWLGQPLFMRQAKGICLTETGSKLQDVCSNVFDLLESECVKLKEGSAYVELKVSCPASFISYWLFGQILEFEKSYPDIKIRLQVDGNFSSVISKKLDILIVSGQGPWPENIVTSLIWSDEIGPVCSPNWHQIPRQVSELRGQPLLHVMSRPDAWAEWADNVGVPIQDDDRGRKLESLSLTIEAARNGLGFAMAPELLVRRDIKEGRLVAPFGFISGRKSFTACLNAKYSQHPAANTFLDWLRMQAQRSM